MILLAAPSKTPICTIQQKAIPLWRISKDYHHETYKECKNPNAILSVKSVSPHDPYNTSRDTLNG